MNITKPGKYLTRGGETVELEVVEANVYYMRSDNRWRLWDSQGKVIGPYADDDIVSEAPEPKPKPVPPDMRMRVISRIMAFGFYQEARERREKSEDRKLLDVEDLLEKSDEELLDIFQQSVINYILK